MAAPERGAWFRAAEYRICHCSVPALLIAVLGGDGHYAAPDADNLQMITCFGLFQPLPPYGANGITGGDDLLFRNHRWFSGKCTAVQRRTQYTVCMNHVSGGGV